MSLSLSLSDEKLDQAPEPKREPGRDTAACACASCSAADASDEKLDHAPEPRRDRGGAPSSDDDGIKSIGTLPLAPVPTAANASADMPSNGVGARAAAGVPTVIMADDGRWSPLRPPLPVLRPLPLLPLLLLRPLLPLLRPRPRRRAPGHGNGSGDEVMLMGVGRSGMGSCVARVVSVGDAVMSGDAALVAVVTRALLLLFAALTLSLLVLLADESAPLLKCSVSG